jgi:hypothetical protein
VTLALISIEGGARAEQISLTRTHVIARFSSLGCGAVSVEKMN